MELKKEGGKMKKIRKRSIFLCVLFLFGLSFPAHAVNIVFNGFSDTTGLTINNDADVAVTADGTVLRVTPALGNKRGSVFSSAAINASTFSTFFKFRITNPGGALSDGNSETGADGLVFVVQSVSSDIGGAGQGIGYNGISPSVGVEFDTWHNSYNNDPDSNHIGIDVNGNVNHGSGSPNTVGVATRFDDGNIWYVWVDYNGNSLEVRANQTGIRPAAPLLTRTLDVADILGQDNAYVGFTSGTGADWGDHDVLYWEYRDEYNPVNPVPEPGNTLHNAMPASALPLVDFPVTFADPTTNIVHVGACSDVVIQPSMKVPATDVGQAAQLIMYIYLPALNFGVNIPSKSVILTDETLCNLLPGPIDLSANAGLEFYVYYGYVLGSSIKYAAYSVVVDPFCADDCGSITDAKVCNATPGCTYQQFPTAQCLMDCGAYGTKAACESAFGGNSCAWNDMFSTCALK